MNLPEFAGEAATTLWKTFSFEKSNYKRLACLHNLLFLSASNFKYHGCCELSVIYILLFTGNIRVCSTANNCFTSVANVDMFPVL